MLSYNEGDDGLPTLRFPMSFNSRSCREERTEVGLLARHRYKSESVLTRIAAQGDSEMMPDCPII